MNPSSYIGFLQVTIKLSNGELLETDLSKVTADDMPESEFDAQVAYFHDLAESLTKLTYLSLEVRDHGEISINPQHIMWIKVDSSKY